MGVVFLYEREEFEKGDSCLVMKFTNSLWMTHKDQSRLRCSSGMTRGQQPNTLSVCSARVNRGSG